MPKISRITLYPFSIPLKHPFQIATMTSTQAEGVFLRLETDTGHKGWGEATPLHSINGETQATVIATLQKVGPTYLNQKVTSFSRVANDNLRTMPGQSAALSALDMALYDAASQAAGLPLAEFLIGTHRNRLQSDITIGITSLPETVTQTQNILDKNVFVIKVKTGLDPQNDYDRVHAVRNTAGPNIAIRIDANQGYDAPSALRALELLAPLDIQFCEQPVPRHDLDGLKWLHQRSPIPIMADESCFGPEDAAHLAKTEACKLINIKLSKSGGLYRARQIADVCHAHNTTCMMGGMVETRLGVTAAAHLAASHPAIKYYDLDAHDAHSQDPIEGGLTLDNNGETILPQTPGLGAAPSDQFLNTLTPIEIN